MDLREGNREAQRRRRASLTDSQLAEQRRRNVAEVAAYQRRFPERHAARQEVQKALRRGDLVRPSKCSRCLRSPQKYKECVRIEASHDDYSQPLVVEWLCVPCHRAKDRAPHTKMLVKVPIDRHKTGKEHLLDLDEYVASLHESVHG